MKKLTILTVYLLTVLSLYSQQRLTTIDSGIVPVKALKNALIVKSKADFCKNQLKVVQDSVAILQQSISTQSKIISNLQTKVNILTVNDSLHVEIQNINKKQIEETTNKLNKATTQLKFGKILVATLIGTTGTLIIVK